MADVQKHLTLLFGRLRHGAVEIAQLQRRGLRGRRRQQGRRILDRHRDAFTKSTANFVGIVKRWARKSVPECDKCDFASARIRQR